MTCRYFRPEGESTLISLTGMTAQTFALPTMTGTVKAIRLMSIKSQDEALIFINMGNEAITATRSNSMPIDLSNRREVVIPIVDETHIAIICASGSTREIMLTGGELI